MTTSIELVPASGRASQFRPQYNIDERQMQQYQPSKYQAWSPEASQTPFISDSNMNENKSGSCKKHLTTKLAMSIFIGLVICGIPLAVIASLYAQKKASPSSSTGNTDSSSNSVSLPTQCTTYTSNADSTRLVTYTGCSTCLYDINTYFSTAWYRFVDPAGTRLSTVPSSLGTCGAQYTGWYNGTYPSTTGGTTTGMVCVNYSGNLCHPTYSITSISVTNCNGFYVFYLTPMTTAFARYCTTF